MNNKNAWLKETSKSSKNAIQQKNNHFSNIDTSKKDKSQFENNSKESSEIADSGENSNNNCSHVGIDTKMSNKCEVSKYQHESSDEDDVNDEACNTIISTVLGQFHTNAAEGRMQELIREGLSKNVCLVCMETIKKVDAVWNCIKCYCMLHLGCIQQWVRDGCKQSTPLSQQHFPKISQAWFCPKCRSQYDEFPKDYTCFCRKQMKPTFSPWLPPHSCGQLCYKALEGCQHTCSLLCHPGPCPPCPKTIRKSCYCGKGQPQVKRCGSSGWTCMKICHNLLPCRQHTCTDLCHPGECNECKVKRATKCVCGKEVKEMSCGAADWNCEQVCDKLLDCGLHHCQSVCHHGDCPPCSKTCPCGKTRYDEQCGKGGILVCCEVCGKQLSCSKHTCPDLCHAGNCASCKNLVRMRCRCGKKEKEVVCGKEYFCDIKCSGLKSCGVHVCKRKCCDGNHGVCNFSCGRMLSCRHHKCNNTCHTGACYPCPLMTTISCNCSKTYVKVPCGAERHMKAPKCHLPCLIPPVCKHPRRTAHQCHFGPCPRCTQECGLERNTCRHACTSPCHTAVEVKMKKEKVAGPWETNKLCDRVQVVDLPCPPCSVPLTVSCKGNHEETQLPCSEARKYSCHRPCGKSLLCGNHTCQLQCHEADQPCEECSDMCQKPRKCDHPCLLPCHPGVCPPCSQMCKMRCHCDMVVLHVACLDWCGADLQIREQLKSCSSRCPKLLSCGHACRLTCHSGKCSETRHCVHKVKVLCKCGLKKVVECNAKQQIPVQCDDVCEKTKAKAIEQKNGEKRKKDELEGHKNREEVEAFDRGIKGGRRRIRRNFSSGENEDISIFRIHKNKIIISIIVLFVSFFVYELLIL